MLGATLRGSGNYTVLLQVTNLGSMSVSLLEAGLKLKNGEEFNAMQDLGFADNLSFVRIDPKAMVQTKLPAEAARLFMSRSPLAGAYATTVCGTKVSCTGGFGVDAVNAFFVDGIKPYNAR